MAKSIEERSCCIQDLADSHATRKVVEKLHDLVGAVATRDLRLGVDFYHGRTNEQRELVGAMLAPYDLPDTHDLSTPKGGAGGAVSTQAGRRTVRPCTRDTCHPCAYDRMHEAARACALHLSYKTPV